MLFRPSESSKNITEFYRRYLLTTFATNNAEYNRQLKEALEKDKAIADGPYISMGDPFEKGKSLVELAEEGLLSKEIVKIKDFHPNRTLYRHQEEAIRKIESGKNAIVTTGTGSGKTESFLIPVINQLLREKENKTLDSGVRTLIIYPMNALVNDQVRRIRELLASTEGGSDITFGRFTGETKEKYSEAKAQYEEVEDVEQYPLMSNELICREQMRATPPNILITNYAMLEYLLLRPGDNIIFSKENAMKWQFIVFDEAHSYTGAKGIEVSALIRRVKAMLGRDDIRFILTSATLGDKNSNDKIVEFGKNLCSTSFDDLSIVRSYTTEAKPSREIIELDRMLYADLAKAVRDNLDDESYYAVIEKYGQSVNRELSLGENLYDLILHDSFYFDVRKALLGRIKTVKQVARELEISEDDFTDYIAVASSAVKDGERLFDAKYHMFLRGIEGVYVTLNPSNKLFIHKMDIYKEHPEKDEDGYKAYEISFCDNCNALYITGEIENGRLIQRGKYSDEYRPEVFLVAGELDDIENVLPEDEYIICSVCGEIAHKTSENGLQCGHGDVYKNNLIRIKKSGEELHKCACCNSINTKRGILRPYYLGNEAATAVISTALYNELPSLECKTEKKQEIDDLFGITFDAETTEIIKHTKQFLAFSDNRQSAAFFASYLGTTYKDSLIKRIVFSLIDERKQEFKRGISLPRYVSLLTLKFKEYNIYPGFSEEELEKEAWKKTLKELSNYKAKNSLMRTAGLIFESEISAPKAPEKLGLSLDELNILFKALVRTIMRDSAVKPGIEMLEKDEEEFAAAGHIIPFQFIKAKESVLNGWMPDDGKTNQRLKYATKVLRDEDLARSLLSSVWKIMEAGGFLEDYTLYSTKGKVLNPNKIIVKVVDHLYICESCKRVSPYNIHNVCDGARCEGVLSEYDYSQALKNHHYRNLYSTLDIAPLNVKEHTAQLANTHAYEYQKEFKDKKINVLSCSTTFEMGVDVGSLETVFMRNMPPSPANYAQRAGRAGRSVNAAAYALTYCPNSSHDLNYFRDPTTMIKGTITPPDFNVSNDKIVLRHLFASAFSFFWKQNPSLYKAKIGDFIEADGFKAFEEYVKSNPIELKNYLIQIVPAELHAMLGVNSFGWIEKLFSEDSTNPGFCNLAIAKYEDDINELTREKKKLEDENNTRKASYLISIMYSINTIRDQGIIEFLSKNNLIPKYGFPVDTVELIRAGRKKKKDDINLSRDLMTAISEYAPGSEVVADGKRFTSRYIKKLTGHEWPKYKYKRCDNCSTLNKVLFTDELKTCKQCGEPLAGIKQTYIIPKFGFEMETGEPKPVGTEKPERTYHGVISYIGDENKIDFYEYEICGKRLALGNSKMDSLAVLNESPFYVCESCGYTKLEDKPSKPVIEYPHYNSSGYKCSNKLLIKYSIGHEFNTDVALIKFLDSDVSDASKAWTILYSLLEGLSRSLNIDRNEVSGCLQWYQDANHPSGNFAFVLFDNTPGGAGYVRQLKDENAIAEMMREGFRVVSTCSCGEGNADTACYSCLCNYYNQKQHDILKRRFAIDFYKEFNASYSDKWKAERKNKLYVKDPVEEEIKIEEVKDLLDLRIVNSGLNQENESVEAIWQNLIDDCSSEEEDLISEIIEHCPEKIHKPFYNACLEIVASGKQLHPDLVWPRQKTMLFLADNTADYLEAKETGWRCFSTEEPFDIKKFVKVIGV